MFGLKLKFLRLKNKNVLYLVDEKLVQTFENGFDIFVQIYLALIGQI